MSSKTNKSHVALASISIGIYALWTAGYTQLATPEAMATQANKAKRLVVVGKITTIVGKITAVDPGSKEFTLATIVKDAIGKQTTKKVTVQWSERADLYWKVSKRGVAGRADLKVGTEVIVQADAGPAGSLIAREVWLRPEREPIGLTRGECGRLGCIVVSGGHNGDGCPYTATGGPANEREPARCQCSRGSACIDE